MPKKEKVSEKRQRLIDSLKRRISKCEKLTFSQMFDELQESLSDVVLNIRLDCAERGFTDGYKLSTANTIIHALYRRDEMALGTQGRDPIVVGYEFKLPEPKQLEA
jgi:hypothetical protein